MGGQEDLFHLQGTCQGHAIEGINALGSVVQGPGMGGGGVIGSAAAGGGVRGGGIAGGVGRPRFGGGGGGHAVTLLWVRRGRVRRDCGK